MKNKNTNKTILIALESIASLTVLILCLLSMGGGEVLVFGALGLHTVLIFAFSLVYSSSDAFMNTDRLFVKRFALASILSDLVMASSRTDCVFTLPLIGAYRTKIIIFLILFQLANLLGTVIFYKKYTSKGVSYYKRLSTVLCFFILLIIPYSGSLFHTLRSLVAFLPITALAVGIVYGCFAQIADPGQDAAPLRNLSLLAILSAEILELSDVTLVSVSVTSGLLLVALIWVIIVERVNARHFR